MRRGLTFLISEFWDKEINGMTKFCQIIGKFIYFNRAANLFFKSYIVPISKMEYLQMTTPPFMSDLRLLNIRGK